MPHRSGLELSHFRPEMGQSEVDPMGGTTASGFVIGRGTVSDLSQESSHEGLLLLRLWACGQGGRVVQAKRHVYSPRVENAARAGAPHRHGRLPAQSLMRPAGVVEGNPRADAGPRLTAIRIAL